MAVDPLTAVANAISGIAGVAQPFIEDYIKQKYENECKERQAKWQDILADPDIHNQPDAIQSYIVRLTSDAGASASGVGTCRSVPLDSLTALVNIACAKIKDDELLANIQFKKT